MRISKPLLLTTGFALLAVACQDYPFEEVVWNVFEMEKKLDCVPVNAKVDILFVVDNSHSMAGEQIQLAQSFKSFAAYLNEHFTKEDMYRIAIVTTGMESDRCWRCDDRITSGCINETGENGRFQDRLGHIDWSEPNPEFDFISDASCRVISASNLDCFYDEVSERGSVLVGVNGCGFERGLEAMRRALQSDLRDTHNNHFFREEATLAVIVVSDEEDCGNVGDVSEVVGSAAANTCYYAAKGVGPDGSSYHPDDTRMTPYRLTPVEEYHDFLVSLKNGQKNMIKFAAIVGMQDKNDPSSTIINYEGSDPSSRVIPACSTPNCEGSFCEAYPGTRYIEMARMFGDFGYVNTICQEDFSQTMKDIAGLIVCPRVYSLDREIFDLDLVAFQLNGEDVPRFTCTDSLAGCGGFGDEACAPGECLKTWEYIPPAFEGGKAKIELAEHYNPCLNATGHEVCLELFYVPDAE